MYSILVPVDGSDNSIKAVKKGIEIGTLRDAHITLITVVNSLRDNPYILDQDYTSELSKKNIANGHRILEEALKLFEGCPCGVDTVLKNGDVAENIINASEELNSDLIIMGRRGLSISARSLLGSISNKVLNYSDRSVLVVK